MTGISTFKDELILSVLEEYGLDKLAKTQAINAITSLVSYLHTNKEAFDRDSVAIVLRNNTLLKKGQTEGAVHGIEEGLVSCSTWHFELEMNHFRAPLKGQSNRCSV